MFSFQDTLLDHISFKVFVECTTDKFVQFQKDILEDFVAEFTNAIKTAEAVDITDIKSFFEESLQVLNTKFRQFAEKVRDVERFQLKGVIQLVIEEALMSSMIGEVTLMIMREQKVLYTLANGVDMRAKIDVFSDFIEGALERDDQIIYIGTKIADVMDQHDRKEMEHLLSSEEYEEGAMAFLEDLLTTRMEKEHIGFIITYTVKAPSLHHLRAKKRGKSALSFNTAAYLEDLGNKIHNSDIIQKLKKHLLGNRYYLVALLLGLLIIFMVYALASQWTSSQSNEEKFQTQSGTYIDITIDDIQREMMEFQALDASSDTKSVKYAEISQKLAFLEEKGKWIEDVEHLKTILQSEYYKGFNIIYIKNLNQFDDITSGRKTKILTFNTAELSRLGELHSIQIPQNMMIGGTKGALIDAMNDASRGVLVAYNLDKSLDGCAISLLKNGIYCYAEGGEIYLVTKSGIEPVTTSDGDFRSNIGGIGTFNRNNFYVFQKTISSVGNALVSRYRNTAGSQTQYQGGTSYNVLLGSGMNFGAFSSFAIDGSFFGRSNNKPYLFRRSDPAGTSLSYREIKISGGDTKTQNYSDNVKILTSSATRYIYLFDRNNQTFTAYDTQGIKTNDANKATYQMKYLFSFKFDLGTSKVYDVAIPESSGDKPELYLLSTEGVNKIALYEFIESIKSSNQLKTVGA
ncbi:MAG: hypothetical protein LBD75_00730 [Candidatus Peribacteria bacterium]|nr:hypothetical protein [Candidatus Peribacteria bacterium]